MIVYAVIARAKDAVILVEVTSPDLRGNVATVTGQLLEHLRDNPRLVGELEYKTFVQRNESEQDFLSHFMEACVTALEPDSEAAVDEHYFHVILKDGVYYCCLGDDPDTRDQKVNFAFLEHLSTEFTKMYRPWRINVAHAYGMDKNFGPSLRSALHYHNVNHEKLARDAKVQAILSQVEDFKQVMGRNINVLLNNTDSISRLMQKSDMMTADAQIFKKKSKQLRTQNQRKVVFTTVIMAVILLVLLYMAVLGICGSGLESCRVTQQSGNANYGGSGSSEGYNGGGYGGGNQNANGNGSGNNGNQAADYGDDQGDGGGNEGGGAANDGGGGGAGGGE